jgi:hypothetical protein
MRLEPPAGPARLSGRVVPRICRDFDSYAENTAVLLPDGRIWESGALGIEGGTASLVEWTDPLFKPLGGTILAKAGWKDMACTGRGIKAGLRSDGSLWINKNDGKEDGLWPHDLERVGTDNDWKSVNAFGFGFGTPRFLKSDGTLWRLEETWTSDGFRVDPKRPLLQIGNAANPPRMTPMDRAETPADVFSQSMLLGPFAVFSAPMTRRTDWIAAVVPSGYAGLASMWFSLTPAEISATPPWGRSFIALAADGTLCEWRSPDGLWRGDGLLGPSRRPLWCLNVLADSGNREMDVVR